MICLQAGKQNCIFSCWGLGSSLFLNPLTSLVILVDLSLVVLRFVDAVIPCCCTCSGCLWTKNDEGPKGLQGDFSS